MPEVKTSGAGLQFRFDTVSTRDLSIVHEELDKLGWTGAELRSAQRVISGKSGSRGTDTFMVNTKDNLVLDWIALRKLKQRPKLREVANEPKLILENYYQIGEHEYVHASHQWDDGFSEQTIYVNEFMWAPSYGSFQRAISRRRSSIALDDGAIQDLPVRLQLSPKCLAYGELHAEILRNNPSFDPHFDLYDEHSLAIGSYLRFEALSFFFRSARPVSVVERPFAVALLTNKRLLIPAGR